MTGYSYKLLSFELTHAYQAVCLEEASDGTRFLKAYPLDAIGLAEETPLGRPEGGPITVNTLVGLHLDECGLWVIFNEYDNYAGMCRTGQKDLTECRGYLTPEQLPYPDGEPDDRP